MYFFGDDDVEGGCVFVWSARKRVMVCVENFEIKTKKKKRLFFRERASVKATD